MHRPTIDFHRIRSHHGCKNVGFEELVCQLAALASRGAGSFHRKGIGADAGLECYLIERNGQETGWQAKYFFALGDSQTDQLKGSFDRAVEKHPKLTRFIVCLPFDLSDGRIPGRRSERDRWDAWVAARRASAPNRDVQIELWGASELTERLSRSDPLHVGRLTYWFDVPHFGPGWFRDRFEITRKALGRRYTPELNVELPIRRALLAFARDPEFTRQILEWADDLDEAWYRLKSRLTSVLKASDAADIKQSVTAVSNAIRETPLAPTRLLPFDHWAALVAAAREVLDQGMSRLWSLEDVSEADQEALRMTQRSAWRLRDILEDLAAQLAARETRAANARSLLLTGEAGVGKSHLLADIANQHIARGFPAVLTLGSAFYDADPWRQIAEQLGLGSTSPDAILGALDAAAEAAGTRALVIIDAINERNGISVWSDRLAAFLAVAGRFDYVGVLISCRTTFVDYIVRDLDDTALPRIEHPGFAGRAAEAARCYLDQRGIVRMGAPHFAPELENPLFLRTLCDMLERTGERELPRGLSGVSSIFKFYLAAVATELNQRMGLVPRHRRVEKALTAISDAMVKAGTGYLPIDSVTELIERIHPSNGIAERDLFTQLEHEGVIAVELIQEGDSTHEMVRFTFERLSDHRIAQRLLETQVGDGAPAHAFGDGGPLRGYVIGEQAYRYAGIAEAFAIQLPERYGVELLDVVEPDDDFWNLEHAFQQSLLWRRQDVFTKRTLELVAQWAETTGHDAVIETLLSIATEPQNRFNADYLDQRLRLKSMPERDEQWSIRVTESVEKGGEAVNTLIEWVLANGLDEIEEDRARLAAITLAWLTSLSHRWVRDMATKALACLLVNRRRLAASLIEQFSEVDDAYVLDRVLAAAYGAATRSLRNDGLAELARSAFTAVFGLTPLPTHALVRDHARGILELAADRGVVPDELPINVARPPYPGGSRLEIISEQELARYVEDYPGGTFRDEICGSAISDGDFARYMIDYLAGRFLLLPLDAQGRSMREIFDEWYSTAVVPHPERVAALERVIQLARRAYPGSIGSYSVKIRFVDSTEELDEENRSSEGERDEAIRSFECLLDEAEIQDFRSRAVGFIRGRMWDERAPAWHPTYAGERSRHWIAWRAHELGWTPERFGDFDRRATSPSRTEHRVERIGKKYQWIAFHELTGRLSDIALVGASYEDRTEFYQGPWQVDTREMDPTILLTRTRQAKWPREPTGGTWWSPHSARWSNDPPEARIAWMKDRSWDVPDPVRQIDVTDPMGRRWLVLDIDVGRDQWVMVDGERTIHRRTWHRVRSALVSRDDASRLQTSFRNARNDHMFDPRTELRGDGYLGEYPWHPAFENVDGEWTLGDNDSIPIQATVADWFVERAGHNFSLEESFNLMVPAPVLIRGLGLRLAEGRSLSYADGDGRTLFKDPSESEPGFSAAVVDRDAMRAFLDAEGLELILFFSGEKSAHGGLPHGRGWGGELSYRGSYRLEGDHVVGSLDFVTTKPSPEQLSEFLDHP